MSSQKVLSNNFAIPPFPSDFMLDIFLNAPKFQFVISLFVHVRLRDLVFQFDASILELSSYKQCFFIEKVFRKSCRTPH